MEVVDWVYCCWLFRSIGVSFFWRWFFVCFLLRHAAREVCALEGVSVSFHKDNFRSLKLTRLNSTKCRCFKMCIFLRLSSRVLQMGSWASASAVIISLSRVSAILHIINEKKKKKWPLKIWAIVVLNFYVTVDCWLHNPASLQITGVKESYLLLSSHTL